MKNNTTCTCTPTKFCFNCFAESFNNNLNIPIKLNKTTKKINENRIIYNKICVCCDNEFTTNTPQKRTCSDDCAKNRQKEQIINYRKKQKGASKNNI